MPAFYCFEAKAVCEYVEEYLGEFKDLGTHLQWTPADYRNFNRRFNKYFQADLDILMINILVSRDRHFTTK